MFKSAEKLRHEAAQRQLDRVASTWRSARTTWFDGTPASIEARLAATDRILAVARSGYSPAHLELTVEAENARRELLAARHRLLVDFLDDGARAFKGSRRVAGYQGGEPGLHRRDAALHTAVNLEDSLRGLEYESNEDNYDPEYGDPRFHHRHPDAECEHCNQPLYTEHNGERWTHVNNDGEPVDSDHKGIPTDDYFGGPEEQCHHGLSAWLCADPINHYPRDM